MGKKVTTDEFIERARQVHGDRYDYSEVEYANNKTKVTIICCEHGSFQILPAKHLYRGSGCAKCSGRYTLTQAEFIEEAKKVHGSHYDYSKVKYVNGSSKAIIICPKHGRFQQLSRSHLTGSGCTKCGIESRAKKRTKTTEKFIQEAREVHGDEYDYSKVEYSGQYKGVKIICSLHGVFTQDPKVHLMGSGCPECGLLTIGDKKRLTQNEFIERSKELHGDKYDYANVEYLGAHRKVKIICPAHGLFEQNPVDHQRGKGCPACSGVERYGQEGFIERAKTAHGDKYDYSKVEYVNAQQKVTIVCLLYGEFTQKPTHHIRGIGCPGCKADTLRDLKVKTKKQFVGEAMQIHGNRYDYSQVEYIDGNTNIAIICSEHGPFLQQPRAHLQKSGCPLCAESGIKLDGPGIMYYLRIET
jgi:hypothetical protein